MKRFFPFFKKYTHLLVFDLFCASLTTICELALPKIVGVITDTAISDLSALSVTRILQIALFYIFLRCIDAAANFYMTSGGHVMGTKIETDMRNALFEHLQHLSFSFYDNTKIGQLMARITSDLFDVTEFAHHFPEELFITFIKITVGFIMFASMDIRLALLVFSVLPVMIFITRKSRKKMKATFKETRHQIGEINAQIEDSLLGIRVVKSFANEEVEEKKFRQGAGKYFRLKKKGYRYMGVFHTTVRLFDGIMYIVVVSAGAIFMMNGNITPGDFSASLLLISTLLGSIRRIVEFSEQVSMGLTGIERFCEIMDELPEIADNENALSIENVRGEIEFKDVSFKYSGTDKFIFENLSLKIQPGENIAIVGPSGGGKTTLCNLIPRFYEATCGAVLLDGINIKDITLNSLRSNIGVVQQDVYLFSGSVRENIAYGCPEASEEDIIAAAKKAGAHEFISALPDGYNTYVGERGVKLSGGQKQRISIARVFLKNPPILILDEATSSLDNESERLVQQSLERLAVGRTTITIAHRLTTIRNATEILVLTDDGISEQGSHRELINQNGIYAELYNFHSEM